MVFRIGEGFRVGQRRRRIALQRSLSLMLRRRCIATGPLVAAAFSVEVLSHRSLDLTKPPLDADTLPGATLSNMTLASSSPTQREKPTRKSCATPHQTRGARALHTSTNNVPLLAELTLHCRGTMLAKPAALRSHKRGAPWISQVSLRRAGPKRAHRIVPPG